jgi:GAF domain-containing protein
VIKVSQAVSGEIVLANLIDTLMRIAMAQPGAERALLLLLRGLEPRIEAEATTSGDTVVVHPRDQAVTDLLLPMSLIQYVLRTRDGVILDDAAAHTPFGDDPYIRQRRVRCILCVPLLHQPPDLGEVREALGCVVGNADRAGDIIDRIRDHIKRAPPKKDRFDLNEAIRWGHGSC